MSDHHPLNPNDLMSLRGKIAVITGSTRGIGLATARLLASAGARVVISSRKPEACAAVCAQLQAEGADVLAVPCHVGRAVDRDRLIDTVLQQWGGIDVLVINAAINPLFAPLQDTPDEVWSKVIDTNLTAPWHLSRRVAPVMQARGGGAIVMLSSIASLLAVPDSGPYAISKAAENHLVRQLAAELGPQQIRVNAVAPGTTRTDMIRSLVADEAAIHSVIERVPLRRIGEPEDIAAAALFLSAPASRHITGQVLVVDGGQTLSSAAR